VFQVKRIAICNANIETGDAVSNDVVGMYRVLVDRGYKVALFASDCTMTQPDVESVEKIESFLKAPDDIFIYHYTTGWDYGLKLLRSLNCRKVIKYHNVTPPEFFEGINSEYVAVCRAGRQQLIELTTVGADLFIADSEYSKHELIQFGAEEQKCSVVPPFHHIDRLQEIEADLIELDQFNDGVINLLMVGRLSPNKGHSSLIDTYAVYNRNYNRNSRLLIVGPEPSKLEAYTLSLRRKVKSIGLEERIIFTGKVSDAELKSYYLAAHVFVITSLHEGFCVPLVEAMSMKIPIVAYASSAIPYTAGTAGIVWDECDPELMAASVDKIVREEHLRIALGDKGWNRYQDCFTTDKIETVFLETLNNLL
jgi:glycosyltransferase involved in cell wall biosynthesis